MGRLDQQRHVLRARRDDRRRTLAARVEWRDAAAQSLYRIERSRKWGLAPIILAAQMARQCAIIGFFPDYAFAQ